MTLAIHACKLRSQAKEWPANGPLPKPSTPLRPAIPAQMLPEVSSRFSNWHHLLEQQKQQSFSRTSSFRHPPLPPLDAIAPAQLRGPTSKSMPALQGLSSSCSRLSWAFAFAAYTFLHVTPELVAFSSGSSSGASVGLGAARLNPCGRVERKTSWGQDCAGASSWRALGPQATMVAE